MSDTGLFSLPLLVSEGPVAGGTQPGAASIGSVAALDPQFAAAHDRALTALALAAVTLVDEPAPRKPRRQRAA